MNQQIETNPLIDRLPPHLKQFIKPQDYKDYTPINQAVWRFVMRKNISYLGKVAHHSYTKGIEQTGISIDAIPSMYGMNRICLLYTSPSPRDQRGSRMPSSA